MVVSSLGISESNRLTILSYDNSGEIKFDVDIEMEQGYWNTSSSRLWTRIRDLFHDELIATYKDMRANGVTYENIMHYMYDEQIAKIPQKYYNMDFDIKYAPYADTYLGKAHGDGLQHMKRWLKKRFIFCDTLFDYAPSYENDVLTIRANTLDQMNLTIETYTPLYQHVSFYNGNMEKIKVKPGEPITFSGYAQTATDQEVLIYGGSNIKKITGISSCNPNSMLIGDAPRLTELDISNCPILTIVNSNKANFSPHTYLNKLNMSNCPQLGGNLNVSNSPLLQEIDARNSAITGLLLPTSLRNLEVMRLPNTIQDLTLHDVPLLHTIELDEGNALNSLSLSNCSKLDNCINFDLTKVPTISLDNSFDTEELYMSETTNLTLKNMSLLKRVIFTPNSEYSEFDINNVLNGANYKITTFNNPMMTDFITTAPHRLSYGKVGTVTPTQLESVYFDSTAYVDLGFIPTSNMKIELDVQMEFTKQYAHWVGSDGTNKIQWGTNSTHIQSDNKWTMTPTSNLTTRQTYTISCATGGNANLYLFCGYYNGNVEIDNCGKGTLYNCKIYDGEKLIHNYIPCDILGEICLCDMIDKEIVYATGTLIGGKEIGYIDIDTDIKDYGDIAPNTVFTANTLDLSDTQFQNVKFLCTTDVYNLKVPTTMKNFYCDSAFDIDTDVIEDASYEVIHEELIEPYTTNYEGEVTRLSFEYEEISYIINEMDLPGMTPNSNTGEIETYATYNATNFLKVQGGTEYTILSRDISEAVYIYCYDKDYKYLGKSFGEISMGVSTNTISRTIPVGTEYIRISARNLLTTFTIGGIFGTNYTPNIIPSSANGSLIFNMYSNNTTQPTSTSPYMWDLTGLKLEDFYTYGMNNWVKPNDGAIANVGKDKVTIYPKYAYRGAVGNKPTIGNDNGMTFGALSPLKVKQGDSIKVNIQQSFKYAIIDSQGIILAETTNTGAWSPKDTVVKITQPNADKLLIQAYPSGSPVDKVYFNDILFYTNIETLTNNVANDIAKVLSSPIEPISGGNQLVSLESITMPQRMSGYSVRLVNADITPDEYPTMLYPKLIDVTLPITGKLDYTAYNGSSLAWAYAYTTDDVTINPLDSRSQGNITQDYNKLYGTNFVDIVDVWVYKDTDTSKLSTNEAITKAYIELTNDNYKTRIDEVLQYYPNCTDIYLFDDGNVTSLDNMLDGNNNATRKGQIKNITFIDEYFNNLLNMNNCITQCSLLETINNVPNSVTSLTWAFQKNDKLKSVSNIPTNCNHFLGTFTNCYALVSVPTNGWKGNTNETFYGCSSLNQQINIENSSNLMGTFYNCQALTIPPILPSNYTGSMQSCFQGCSSLTTAPNIPDGVTSMQSCFNGCKELITAPNIPSSVININAIFQKCSKLESVTIPLANIPTYYNNALQNCTALTDITWEDERNTNFSLTSLGSNIAYTQQDIQELVPEHLADLTSQGTTATLTLGETYLGYLTEEEITQAVAKGWILQ